MQCPDSKKNVFSQLSWRGTKNAKRVVQDSEDSAQKKLRESLEEVEDKYRKARVSIAQLRNEKRNLEYQVDNLKDVIGEMEEKLSQYQAENRINSKLQKALNKVEGMEMMETVTTEETTEDKRCEGSQA